MAENINIASFDFDPSKLDKNLIDLKNQMSFLKNEITSLRKGASDSVKDFAKVTTEMAKLESEGKKTSEEYQNLAEQADKLSGMLNVQNGLLITAESEMKSLQKEYKLTSDIARALTNSENELISAREKANQLIEQEITTITEARESNKEILLLRNNLNAKIKDGVALNEEELKTLQELNAKLDENNEFIKENVSAYEQQKINIGNYTESIKDALGQLNPFNGGLTAFIGRAQEAGGVGKLLTSSLKQVTTGIIGVTKSALAFIATPIGAIITAIVLAATLLYNIFKSFTPIVDKVEQAFAALSAVFNVIKNSVIALVTGAKSLGDVFSGLGGRMREAAKAAAELKKAQQDLEDAMLSQEVASAKNRAEINKLNIQAKDRTKSEEERLKLLEKAANLEIEDYNQRRAIADETLRQAEEAIRIEGNLTDEEFEQLKKRGVNYKEYVEKKTKNVDDLFKSLASAQKGVYQLDDEFNSQIEKNINRQNKLIEDQEKNQEDAIKKTQQAKERAEQEREKALQREIQRMNEELELWIAQQGNKARTLQEELDFEKRIAEDSKRILKKQLKEKEISYTKYQAEVQKIDNELAAAKTAVVIDNARRELETWVKLDEDKIDITDNFTEEQLNADGSRLEQQKAKELEFQELRFKNDEINAQELADRKLEIEKEFQQKRDELISTYDTNRKSRELTQAELDFESKLIKLQEDGATQFEVEQVMRDEQREEEIRKAQEQAEQDKWSVEMLNQAIYNINREYDNKDKEAKESNDKAIFENKTQLASQALGTMAEIFGKESAAGKAAAIAQTTIDTYKAATAAYAAGASLGGPLGAVMGPILAALAVTSGLMNVKK